MPRMQIQILENTETRGYGMKRYIIDPRLEAVCLPLSKDEYDLLEKQILRDGVLDAVKVWDRDGELVLLDGHNRLKICKDHKLPIPESTTVEIKCIDEAVVWIVDNQRGRRNVATKEQQDYISGKRYEAEKNITRIRGENGIFKSNAPSTDNLHLDEEDRLHQGKTILRRAAEEGVSHHTIGQNQKFAQGVDAIREVSPELAEKILKPEPNAPSLAKSVVAALPKLKKKMEKEPEKFTETVKKLEDAIDTKDKEILKKVVHESVRPGEPTTSEKIIAAKRNLKPEHVQYAHEHNIPIENLKTVDQLAAIEARKPTSCATTWDGFYDCECGLKFEIFGSKCAPRWCPQCGKVDSLKRFRS